MRIFHELRGLLLEMGNLPDLLEVFRRGGEMVSEATSGCSGIEADFRMDDSKWSVRQIVCHLADTQLVIGMSLRLILAEDHPSLLAFDEDAWARKLDYGKRRIVQALETFHRLRTDDYELLRDQPAAAFNRTGHHVEHGVVTLRQIVEQQVAHVENRIKEINAVRSACADFLAKSAPTKFE
jgi:hypothetical protein